jgi:two-component sensor histidine kinase
MGFGHEDRVSISGPPLVLQPNAVQYLGIAFHELATNSAKYGVLSGHSGKIAVEWSIFSAKDGTAFLRLVWCEEEGPEVVGVRAGGFGTVVLERVAPQSLNGTGRVEYGANGVIWTLEAPLHYVEVSLDAQLAT